MMSRRQCLRGGLVNVLKAERDDVTRAMPKGGACECLPPPPFRKSCIRAPRTRSFTLLTRYCEGMRLPCVHLKIAVNKDNSRTPLFLMNLKFRAILAVT